MSIDIPYSDFSYKGARVRHLILKESVQRLYLEAISPLPLPLGEGREAISPPPLPLGEGREAISPPPLPLGEGRGEGGEGRGEGSSRPFKSITDLGARDRAIRKLIRQVQLDTGCCWSAAERHVLKLISKEKVA